MRDTVKYTDYKRYHTSVTIEYAGQQVKSEPGSQADKPQTPPAAPAKPQ